MKIHSTTNENVKFVTPYYCLNCVIKSLTKKRQFFPTIPTTRNERALKRQKLFDQMLTHCTHKKSKKIKNNIQRKRSVKQFTKSFNRTNFRSRSQRIDMIASLIVGSCLDRTQQSSNGSSYILKKI